MGILPHLRAGPSPKLGGEPGMIRSPLAGDHRLLPISLLLTAVLAALLALGVQSRRAFSIPLYARQTGQPCATCHTAFLELNPFGRRFKLGGYTLNGGDWTGPPFAVMLEAPTYTHTEAGQTGGAAPHFGPNNNFAFQQASLFTGGRPNRILATIRGNSARSGLHRRSTRPGYPVPAPIPLLTSASIPSTNISVIPTPSPPVLPGSTRTTIRAPARRWGLPAIPTTSCDL